MKKIYLIIINVFTISLLCDPSYAQSLENQIIKKGIFCPMIKPGSLILFKFIIYFLPQ